MAFDNTINITGGNDGAHSIWNTIVGEDAVGGSALWYIYIDLSLRGEDLPRGNTHVWKEAYLQGNDEMGEI